MRCVYLGYQILLFSLPQHPTSPTVFLKYHEEYGEPAPSQTWTPTSHTPIPSISSDFPSSGLRCCSPGSHHKSCKVLHDTRPSLKPTIFNGHTRPMVIDAVNGAAHKLLRMHPCIPDVCGWFCPHFHALSFALVVNYYLAGMRWIVHILLVSWSSKSEGFGLDQPEGRDMPLRFSWSSELSTRCGLCVLRVESACNAIPGVVGHNFDQGGSRKTSG